MFYFLILVKTHLLRSHKSGSGVGRLDLTPGQNVGDPRKQGDVNCGRQVQNYSEPARHGDVCNTRQRVPRYNIFSSTSPAAEYEREGGREGERPCQNKPWEGDEITHSRPPASVAPRSSLAALSSHSPHRDIPGRVIPQLHPQIQL